MEAPVEFEITFSCGGFSPEQRQYQWTNSSLVLVYYINKNSKLRRYTILVLKVCPPKIIVYCDGKSVHLIMHFWPSLEQTSSWAKSDDFETRRILLCVSAVRDYWCTDLAYKSTNMTQNCSDISWRPVFTSLSPTGFNSNVMDKCDAPLANELFLGSEHFLYCATC